MRVFTIQALSPGQRTLIYASERGNNLSIIKKITAVMLVLIIALASGCTGKNENKTNDGTTEKQTIENSPVTGEATESSETTPSNTPAPPVSYGYDDAVLRIAALKGPTSIGMLRLIEQNEAGLTKNKYHFEIFGTADEIVTKYIKGEFDIVALPANLAAVLYNKTQNGIKVCAVNTLGVLYIVDSIGGISSVNDLKGKTIYATGKGSVPEYALNYVLKQNGINPETDVKIEFRAEAAELAALLASGEATLAMLPEPFVTSTLAQNDKLNIALSLSEEWDKVQPDFSLITGTLIASKGAIGLNQEGINDFLAEYEKSIDYVNTNLAEASDLAVKYGIIGKSAIAMQAIPRCNVQYLDNDEMRTKLYGYLNTLFDANPASVGGTLPGEDFYYIFK